MSEIVPWDQLISLVAPLHDQTGKNIGRPQFSLATMLRIYLMQRWYMLSDIAMEDSLCDSIAMRQFACLQDYSIEETPSEMEILRFRRLAKNNEIVDAIEAKISSVLKSNRLALRRGAVAEAGLFGLNSRP
jgi:IS5 family transposase